MPLTKVHPGLLTAPFRKNSIINGNFDIWQRGTSQTSSSYGSADRWLNENAGSTKTASRISFALGQVDVPNEPRYYARTVVTTSAGAANFVTQQQKVEGVRAFAGQTATLSFYAKADAVKNIATEFAQVFGTGGSPSTAIVGAAVDTHALATTWQKFEVTVTIPSIAGKTLGNNDDDFLLVNFWFDAGSNYNSRANSLGQQSGTFDIAQVQLERGPVATDFEYRHISDELAMCQRYYTKTFNQSVAPAQNSEIGGEIISKSGTASGSNAMSVFRWQFPVRMRAAPAAITLYNPQVNNAQIRNASKATDYTASGANGVGETGCNIIGTTPATVAVIDTILVHATADAEL